MKTHWLQSVLSKFPEIHYPTNPQNFAALVDVIPLLPKDQHQYQCHPTPSLHRAQLSPPTVWALHQQCMLHCHYSQDSVTVHTKVIPDAPLWESMVFTSISY
jgi:hypothetical protein